MRIFFCAGGTRGRHEEREREAERWRGGEVETRNERQRANPVFLIYTKHFIVPPPPKPQKPTLTDQLSPTNTAHPTETEPPHHSPPPIKPPEPFHPPILFSQSIHLFTLPPIQPSIPSFHRLRQSPSASPCSSPIIRPFRHTHPFRPHCHKIHKPPHSPKDKKIPPRSISERNSIY